MAFYTPFLKEVWDKKPEIEQAFHMEEPVTLDSGEGTLEHSHHHLPQPPPRHESYLMKQHSNSIMNNINNNNHNNSHSQHSHDGSGSENYEHLPTRSLNSLNGPDDNIKLNLNDNNEKYHMYRNMMDGGKHMDGSYGGGGGGGGVGGLPDDEKDDKARLLHQGEEMGGREELQKRIRN